MRGSLGGPRSPLASPLVSPNKGMKGVVMARKHRHRWADFGAMIICSCGEARWTSEAVDLETLLQEVAPALSDRPGPRK